MRDTTMVLVSNKIDRKARDNMAESLRHFILGKMTNFEFEKKIPASEDPIILAIDSSTWCFYDDFMEHKLLNENKLPGKLKEDIARWILFLYSDESYEWPRFDCPGIRPIKHGFLSKILGREKKEKEFMNVGDFSFWPFIDRKSYEKAKQNPKLLNKSIT